jgi:hypothetical protein
LLSLVLVEHPYGRNRTYVVVRFAFNKTVVLRYRLQLEARHLSASTINVRLAAVRRLAYEAADSGLLSPELAAMSGALAVVQKLGLVAPVVRQNVIRQRNERVRGLICAREA